MSLARSYVTVQAAFLLLCGFLVLRKERHGTLGKLGLLWVLYACYLFSYPYLYKWEWAFLRDNGSYVIFSGFMLWIWATRRTKIARR